MGGGGNPTWIKYLEEKKDDRALVQVLVSGNMPRNLWIAARIKAITQDQKINGVIIRLIEKWVKNEIEI